MSAVIDAHVHAFPPDFIRGREQLIVSDRWFGHLYENPKAKLTSEHELLDSMDESGIDFSIIAGFPWSDPGRCREHNAWMAEVCRANSDRLGYLAIVVPTDPRASQDFEHALKHGALGVGELNADAQGFRLDQPDASRDLMETCAQAGVPVMLHTSEPVGHVYPGKGTACPEVMVEWLAAFPAQPIVLAHWGGGLPFYELMPEIRALTQNVVYDCAATTYLYDFAIFDTVERLCGVDRIVFGSDFPVLGQKRLLRRVAEVVADDAARESILNSNARRVYGVVG